MSTRFGAGTTKSKRRTVRSGQGRGLTPDVSRPDVSATLDPGTANDFFATVGKSYECFSFSVVVRRPDDERGVLAADAAPLASLLEPAPVAHERVLFPLAADGGFLRVAGKHTQLVR